MKVSASESAQRGMKISDFQTKDVINITDGKRLGQISDLELDLKQGRIEAIVVPGYSRFMGLFGVERIWLFPGGTLLRSVRTLFWLNWMKSGKRATMSEIAKQRCTMNSKAAVWSGLNAWNDWTEASVERYNQDRTWLIWYTGSCEVIRWNPLF